MKKKKKEKEEKKKKKDDVDDDDERNHNVNVWIVQIVVNKQLQVQIFVIINEKSSFRRFVKK